jgi:hypothetical protein
MTSLSVSDLVKNVHYKIYSDGGCKEMETTVFRTFVGVDTHGAPLFYEESMGCPVVYGSSWKFYAL